MVSVLIGSGPSNTVDSISDVTGSDFVLGDGALGGSCISSMFQLILVYVVSFKCLLTRVSTQHQANHAEESNDSTRDLHFANDLKRLMLSNQSTLLFIVKIVRGQTN